ncbi:hypothetical protein P153DRAFT_195329 [Dothidotthia symphoricarpi CBS 119687]|uniref:Uncharacterized protein n=1 Tax=Dothidotthia symphoricarpi CBS 119687 TaxID=1392245 RepID=A0A6A6AHK2_9PLEO|nr:uncharacterized protein P153DRAFT_195329 [Dothidotthia symphoricarpi CBS 119687]KAF2131429.1 hypothetical protein P153DRAFT_195329 [Dothidotthia symphoricarpi CBS 119687]
MHARHAPQGTRVAGEAAPRPRNTRGRSFGYESPRPLIGTVWFSFLTHTLQLRLTHAGRVVRWMPNFSVTNRVQLHFHALIL